MMMTTISLSQFSQKPMIAQWTPQALSCSTAQHCCTLQLMTMVMPQQQWQTWQWQGCPWPTMTTISLPHSFQKHTIEQRMLQALPCSTAWHCCTLRSTTTTMPQQQWWTGHQQWCLWPMTMTNQTSTTMPTTKTTTTISLPQSSQKHTIAQWMPWALSGLTAWHCCTLWLMTMTHNNNATKNQTQYHSKTITDSTRTSPATAIWLTGNDSLQELLFFCLGV